MTAAFLEARLHSPEDQLDHKLGVYIRESTKYKFESE
jgi:hypothetical protein